MFAVESFAVDCCKTEKRKIHYICLNVDKVYHSHSCKHTKARLGKQARCVGMSVLNQSLKKHQNYDLDGSCQSIAIHLGITVAKDAFAENLCLFPTKILVTNVENGTWNY